MLNKIKTETLTNIGVFMFMSATSPSLRMCGTLMGYIKTIHDQLIRVIKI